MNKNLIQNNFCVTCLCTIHFKINLGQDTFFIEKIKIPLPLFFPGCRLNGLPKVLYALKNKMTQLSVVYI